MRPIKQVLLFLIINCGLVNRSSTEKRDEVSVNNKISFDPTYIQMDDDILTYPELTSETIKTSAVTYIVSTFSSTAYECSAYYCDTDSALTIDIGLHSFFGGNGFSIVVHGSKFDVEPYHYNDVVFDEIKEPVYTLISQKLTLDKTHYQAGDSLHGNVEFDITENDNGLIQSHLAKSFFRTKVKSSEN